MLLRMSADDRRIFGRNVRAERIAQGLTQAALADAVSLSAESISNLERGKHAPSFETLIALSEHLGISVGALCSGLGARDKRTPQRIELENALFRAGMTLSESKLRIALNQVQALKDI